MPIAFLTLELHIEAAQSLKDRRQVVRSVKDRLRTSFNVSVAELDASGLWNRATIGVASVSDSREYSIRGSGGRSIRTVGRDARSFGCSVPDGQRRAAGTVISLSSS